MELLTRVMTQYLAPENGDEKTALESIHALFPIPREILRRHGSGSGEFAKLAIPVINQIIRPFTAKWRRLFLAAAFDEQGRCSEFRADLSALQPTLRDYTSAPSTPWRTLRTLRI